MVRIIAGKHKSRRLNTPNTKSIRPTKDRVKESIFSKLFDLSGLRIIDLFAGTGNLGLEALSRGANHCVFVEKQANHINIIKENIESLDVFDKTTLICRDVIQFLKNSPIDADLIFADPPYKYDKTLQLFQEFEKLQPGIKIVFESDKNFVIPEKFVEKCKDEKNFGETKITFYEM